tara:strand:+ start:388 stop:603 length:216 start_codon:yes stop_codon:yes gene_type:complete
MNVIEGKFSKEKRPLQDVLPVLIKAIESGDYSDMVVMLDGEETAFMTTMSIPETYFTLGLMQKLILEPTDD